MQLKLTVPLPISINKLYINQARFFKGKAIPTGKRILSPEGEALKEKIQLAAWSQIKEQDWDYDYTKENFIYMDSYIFFNRKGRDDNNIYKLNNDALEKIVYDNDSRVLTRTQRILYDPNNPRLELIFTRTPFIGVFDTAEQFEKFHSSCANCKRYKNGRCSILRKALEGFVQQEIGENKICLSIK